MSCLRLLRETEDWVPPLLWLLPGTSQCEGRGGVPGGVREGPGVQIIQLQVNYSMLDIAGTSCVNAPTYF